MWAAVFILDVVAKRKRKQPIGEDQGRREAPPSRFPLASLTAEIPPAVESPLLRRWRAEPHDFIHFAEKRPEMKSWSDHTCLSGWIQILWIEMVSSHALWLSFSFFTPVFSLLLKDIYRTHLAVFRLWAAFPWGPNLPQAESCRSDNVPLWFGSWDSYKGAQLY